MILSLNKRIIVSIIGGIIASIGTYNIIIILIMVGFFLMGLACGSETEPKNELPDWAMHYMK